MRPGKGSHGLSTHTISHHFLEVEFLSEAGPRLAGLSAGRRLLQQTVPGPSCRRCILNCNAEAHVYDRLLELETVAPLCRLEPGHEATHHETWELVRVPAAEATPEGLRSVLEALGLG